MVAAILLLASPAAGFFGSHYEQPYLDAVKAWLDDPTDEGAAALIELEKVDGPKLNRLDEAEERMVNDLARIDPRSLLPIAALHRRAYDLHLESASLTRAYHSAKRLRDVVDLYERRVDTPAARAAAARLWTQLGLSLLARGGYHLSPALACLSEALSHVKLRRDATDEMRRERVRALHIRAVVLERIGEPPKALDDLEDLLEIDPEHLEARLRLAVNLMHDEQDEEAEPRLRRLAALDEPAWIAIVANQQLARLLIDRGRPAEAMEVLRGAALRFPRNARLGVLLAYHERPQWQAASRRVAGLLETWRDAPPIRPRARYEGPVDDDGALKLAMEEDLESHLDAARAAIAELEADRAE